MEFFSVRKFSDNSNILVVIGMFAIGMYFIKSIGEKANASA